MTARLKYTRLSLEMWGAVTSRPSVDPANSNLINPMALPGTSVQFAFDPQ
jgi:hypothetical protein